VSPKNLLLEASKSHEMQPADDAPEAGAARDRQARNWKRVIVALVAVNLIGAGIIFFPQAHAALTRLLEWAKEMGAWGIVYLALIYAVACVLFLPGSILTLGAGFAFGLVGGTIATVIGSLLGVTGSFFLGRTIARRWVENATRGHPRFRAIDDAVGREGFKIVLLTRLSPVFPFNLLNYGFGVTRVTFRDFFFGSWVGMFPGTVLYVYVGTAAKSLTDLASGNVQGGTARNALLAIGLVATVLVTIVITRTARRALRNAIPGEDPSAKPQESIGTEDRHAGRE
jgi:uncharacterized membrane protein YdjX (TVP38/TMEM64 family)